MRGALINTHRQRARQSIFLVPGISQPAFRPGSVDLPMRSSEPTERIFPAGGHLLYIQHKLSHKLPQAQAQFLILLLCQHDDGRFITSLLDSSISNTIEAFGDMLTYSTRSTTTFGATSYYSGYSLISCGRIAHAMVFFIPVEDRLRYPGMLEKKKRHHLRR